MSYKITIVELQSSTVTDPHPEASFRYEQVVEDLDVKAIYDLVNKKPRAKRSDAGASRKKEEA